MRDGGYQECGNLLEFSKRFQDEDASRQHLFNRRWPNGFACPRCGGVEYYPHRIELKGASMRKQRAPKAKEQEKEAK